MRDRHEPAPLDPAEGASSELLRVLTGPTASGKTALAIAVARRAGAEVLSMDSMLVYRGMDVGTAKPTRAERAEVPHHLIDLVEPCQAFTVSDWLAAAQRALAEVHGRGVRALFVGGTAFYLKALVAGLFEGPDVDPALRAVLERRYELEGALTLHAELARVDPASAARLHPNDRKRIVRALEVWHQTARPLSAWQLEWGWSGQAAGPLRPHRLVALRVDPPELERRIRARTRGMLESGWVEEVRRLLDAGGLGPTARQALGYGEVAALVEGRLTREQAEERIAVSTRRFARKQRTWLRRFDRRLEVPAPRLPDGADMQRAVREVLTALGW